MIGAGTLSGFTSLIGAGIFSGLTCLIGAGTLSGLIATTFSSATFSVTSSAIGATSTGSSLTSSITSLFSSVISSLILFALIGLSPAWGTGCQSGEISFVTSLKDFSSCAAFSLLDSAFSVTAFAASCAFLAFFFFFFTLA